MGQGHQKHPSQKEIQEFWSERRTKYIDKQIEDHPPGTTPLSEKILEVVYKEGRFNENMIVLDVGCGVGAEAISISKKGSFLVGLDISITKIMVAKRNRDILGQTNRVNFIIGDINYLPLKPQSIDVIVSFAVFQHLHNLGNALHEIARSLSPSGKTIIQIPNKLSPWYYLVRPILSKFLHRYKRKWIIDRKLHRYYLAKLFRNVGLLNIRTIHFGFIPPGHKNPKYGRLYKFLDNAIAKIPIVNKLGGVLIIIGS